MTTEGTSSQGVHSTKRRGHNGGRNRNGSGVEVGRMAVTTPRFGRLDSYRKRDNQPGANVLCEEDGMRYGVTLGLLNRFSKVGTYVGWAYVNVDCGIVFKFLEGEISNRPACLLAIETPEGRVNVPASVAGDLTLEHGMLVAFRARFWGERRQATDLFQLDSKHLPLMAGLIESEKLVFPEHSEVLDVFLEGLETGHVNPQDRGRFDSALVVLAEAPGVSAEDRRRARVERGKLEESRQQAKPPSPPRGRPRTEQTGPLQRTRSGVLRSYVEEISSGPIDLD